MSTVKVEQDRERRLRWFKEARFGMFIHWGLYAQIGRHEWVMNLERIPVEEYELLADSWKPAPNAARAWAKLAKAAGMRYMVMTTKHHEGFCLFDSQLTDYTAAKRGPGRDLVAEYVEAARAEGLHVGFYYSLMDWHHPDGAACLHDEAARRRFVDYTHGLVRELCSNYGKLDILWYDVSWPLSPEGWESERLNAMVRKLQPEIIINDRSGIPEDFGTPEGHITPAGPGRAWESCMTFNSAWGYAPIDTTYHTTTSVLQMLRQVANGNGNLLLNVGPAPDGSVPDTCERVLRETGAWLAKNGESIYTATDPIQQEWTFLGAFTRKARTLYFHARFWPGGNFAIGGLQNVKVVRASFLNGPAIKFTQTGDRVQFHGIPAAAPDPFLTVIALEVDGDNPRYIHACHPELVKDDPSWKK
ncbi:MAG: alpha-L-fucosidase [Armatimonadota bacterium]